MLFILVATLVLVLVTVLFAFLAFLVLFFAFVLALLFFTDDDYFEVGLIKSTTASPARHR